MIVGKNTFFIISLVMLGITVACSVAELIGFAYPGGIFRPAKMFAFLMPMHYLMHYGYMVTTRWKSGFYLLFSVYIVGTLARIQHWPGAELMVLGATLGVPVLYLIYFCFKPFKRVNDILKVIVVFTCFTAIWIDIQWRINNQYVTIALLALLYYTYIDFRKLQKKWEEQRALEGWDFEKMEGDRGE